MVWAWISRKMEERSIDRRVRPDLLELSKRLEAEFPVQCVVYDRQQLIRRKLYSRSNGRHGFAVFGFAKGEHGADSLYQRVSDRFRQLSGNYLVDQMLCLYSPEDTSRAIASGEVRLSFFNTPISLSKPIYGRNVHKRMLQGLKHAGKLDEILSQARESLYRFSEKKYLDQRKRRLKAITRSALISKIRAVMERISAVAERAYAPGVKPEHAPLAEKGVVALKNALAEHGLPFDGIVGRGSVFHSSYKESFTNEPADPRDVDLSVIGIPRGKRLTKAVSFEHGGNKYEVSLNYGVKDSAISRIRLPSANEFVGYANGLCSSTPVGSDDERQANAATRGRYIRALKFKLIFYRKGSLLDIYDLLRNEARQFEAIVEGRAVKEPWDND